MYDHFFNSCSVLHCHLPPPALPWQAQASKNQSVGLALDVFIRQCKTQEDLAQVGFHLMDSTDTNFLEGGL